MALKDVLALLGDAVVRDAGPEELRRLIEAQPGLSDAEREDLLRIPHDRLLPYQQDFYTFEADMLRWGFEHTWAVLKQHAFGAGAENGRTPQRSFMVRFKNQYPSETHSTRELGRHFVTFLRNDCPELAEPMPWLVELADMEQREIDVLYAMDHPTGRALQGEDLERWFEQSVDELLGQEVVRAESVSAVAYAYDLPAIKTAIRESDDEVPIQYDLSPTPLAIARHPDTLVPMWYRVEAWEVALINGLPEEPATEVGALAEQFCDVWETAHPDADVSDEELFGTFLQWLHGALRQRFFLAA